MLSSVAAATEISNPNIKTKIREEKGKAMLDQMKLKNILTSHFLELLKTKYHLDIDMILIFIWKVVSERKFTLKRKN